jgi:hypothetical protein
MTIDVNLGRIGSDTGTTVIVGLFEDDQLEEGTPPILDASLRRYLREILALGDSRVRNIKWWFSIRMAQLRLKELY